MTPLEIAEEALKKANFKFVEGEDDEWWARVSVTNKPGDATSQCPPLRGLDMDTVSFHGNGTKAHVHLRVPIEQVPSLLSPSLTEAEKDALTFLTEECDDFADTLEGVHTDKSVGGTYRETSKVIRSLLSRLGGATD